MIPMQLSFDQLIFLVGDNKGLENLQKVKSLPVFSGQSVSFLAALSKKLLSDKRTRNYPDLSAFAFWIRKSSLETMAKKYTDLYRLGRGVSFHIAPSNVPVAFAMSFTAGLLAGNACVVRVSGKQYAQVDIIAQAVNELFDDEFNEMKPYLFLVRYEHNTEITQTLSGICDVRVIWGGDRTIGTIRSGVLPPRAVELTFADRYSISVINADGYLDADARKIAEAFYMDTYYSDQGACSSPRMVVWIGERMEEARERFWGSLETTVRNRYELQDIQCIDKLDAFCRMAMKHPEIRRIGSGCLTRVVLPEIYSDWMDFRENGGYFFEYIAESLDEIIPVLGKQCQTIGYYGIDPEIIRQIVIKHGVRGVDRIVPMGQTMELSLRWDGFDLVESMSRIVDLKG